MSSESINLAKYLAYSGDVSEMTPDISKAAQLAIDEVNSAGGILGGRLIQTVEIDSYCTDPENAVAGLRDAITSGTIEGIVGPMCSGTAFETVNQLLSTFPIVTVSPSATHSGLGASTRDGGYFFRTIPPNEVEARKSAEYLFEAGVRTVTILKENSGYGSDYARYFADYFSDLGGNVQNQISFAYNESNTSNTVNEITDSPADALLMISAGIFDAGAEILEAVENNSLFSKVHLSESMLTEQIDDIFGAGTIQVTGLRALSEGEAFEKFEALAGSAFDPNALYAAEAYDAAAILLLAMQAAGSSDPEVYRDFVSRVTSDTGTKIYAGELERGIELLIQGGTINYVGASDVRLDAHGDDLGEHELVSLAIGGSSGSSQVAFDVVDVITETKIYGSDGSDEIMGTDASEEFVLSQGNDMITAGAGIDTVYIAETIANISATVSDNSITLFSSKGTAVLQEVERIDCSDASLAFDIGGNGNAGVTAKVLGAAFGSAAVQNSTYAGIGIHYLDQGTTYETLMELALDAALGREATNADIVAHLYENVVGVAPTNTEAQPFIELLESGTYSKGTLGILAAETAINTQNINLAGLAETGLQYTPFE